MCAYAGMHECSPTSPKETFARFLWQRRNSGLCVPWLTCPQLGDCLGWLLTPEKDFFLRRAESVLPPSFIFLVPSGADDFLADMFCESISLSSRRWVGVPVGFLLWQPVFFFFPGSACWDIFSPSLTTLKSSSCPCCWGWFSLLICFLNYV